MRPETLHSLIITWLDKNNFASLISFRENFDPPNDRQDDYTIAYEAVLEPNTEDRARIEIWSTNAARIAIGIETKQRLAHRLGLKALRPGFASGHEPQDVSGEQLEMLLGLVAAGLIGIRFFKAFGFLAATGAVISENNFSILARSGYEKLKWLEPLTNINNAHRGTFHGIAQYEPWKISK
jgi:hypothetical protein